MKRFLLIAIVLVSAISCMQQVSDPRPAVQYVMDIVGDKYCHESLVLQHFNTSHSSGDISIIGTEDACDKIAAFLLCRDARENVDGGCHSDLLPDFAGETIVTIADGSRSGWRSLLESGDTVSVRNCAVMHCIAALDTLYNISMYDLDGVGQKNSTKIIVLADPYFSKYGKFDVDTLFQLSSCNVPVLNPWEIMLDKVLESAERKLNVGVICDSTYLGTDIYESAFLDKAHRSGINNCDCFCASVCDSIMPLMQFLDSYSASGRILPLDAILIDSEAVEIETIQENIKSLVDFSLPGATNYLKLLEKDMRLMESKSVLADECYHILRSSNLFTHKVAYPKQVTYTAICDSLASEKPYLLIPRQCTE